jgi:hypothetical protein
MAFNFTLVTVDTMYAKYFLYFNKMSHKETNTLEYQIVLANIVIIKIQNYRAIILKPILVQH